MTKEVIANIQYVISISLSCSTHPIRRYSLRRTGSDVGLDEDLLTNGGSDLLSGRLG